MKISKIDSIMKKLNYCMELVLLLFLIGTIGCNADSSTGGQPRRIELFANGWMITIGPDGTAGIARLKEANAIFSTASTPPGAVDFNQIKIALEADFSGSSSTLESSPLRAGIRMVGQESLGMKPVRNIEIWNHLIEQLEPKWTSPTLSSFKKAIEKNPLKLESP